EFVRRRGTMASATALAGRSRPGASRPQRVREAAAGACDEDSSPSCRGRAGVGRDAWRIRGAGGDCPFVGIVLGRRVTWGPLFPMYRLHGLLVHDLPDEVLVYDTERHEAYCLNRSAALIWRQYDGVTPPGAMVRPLQSALGMVIDEDVGGLGQPGFRQADWVTGR